MRPTFNSPDTGGGRGIWQREEGTANSPGQGTYQHTLWLPSPSCRGDSLMKVWLQHKPPPWPSDNRQPLHPGWLLGWQVLREVLCRVVYPPHEPPSLIILIVQEAKERVSRVTSSSQNMQSRFGSQNDLQVRGSNHQTAAPDLRQGGIMKKEAHTSLQGS